MNEPRLERMAHNWRVFLADSIAKPQLLTDAAHIARFTELLEGGRKLVSELNVAESFSRWFSLTKNVVSLIANNPATNKLQSAARKLVTNLLLDEHGFPALKTEIFSQMRSLLVNLVLVRFCTRQVNSHTPALAYALTRLHLRICTHTHALAHMHSHARTRTSAYMLTHAQVKYEQIQSAHK